MFGIGLPELILILAIGLIVLGPDKLPELARSLAKGIGELKRSLAAIKEDMDKETEPWRESIRTDLLQDIDAPDSHPTEEAPTEEKRAESAPAMSPAGSSHQDGTPYVSFAGGASPIAEDKSEDNASTASPPPAPAGS